MSEYVMPEVALGDLVLFYPHEAATPSPGIVTAAGGRTLTLWVLGGADKPSVHHVTDPGVHEFPDWKRYGFWEHRPKDPALAILSEKVALLDKKLSALSPKKA